MRLAPLLFVRPGELRTAKWTDINLEEKQWRYIVTKTKTPQIVPLSRQAIEILNELRPLPGKGTYVFPSARTNSRPMTDNAILAAMRRAGIEKEEMSTDSEPWRGRYWMRCSASGLITSNTNSPMLCVTQMDEPTTARRIFPSAGR